MSEDYPRTLMELEERFSTEEACVDYLAEMRWPEGFRVLGMWRGAGVEGDAITLGLPQLRVGNHGYRWHDLRR